MDKIKLQEILENHQMWLNNEPGGVRADLNGANLNGANLSRVDLRGVNLSGADLCDVDLSCANLSGADLSYTNLNGADLICADLSDTDLSEANLNCADLRHTNLSGAKGLISTIDFIETHFERTDEGYIAYKTFDGSYSSPEQWDIKSGSILTENVNFDRCCSCGCGINVAPLEWVKENYPNQTIWKVLIRYEWLCGVCVPYHSDGKIRCERVELIEVIE